MFHKHSTSFDIGILKTPRKTPCLSPINTKTPIALLSDVLPA